MKVVWTELALRRAEEISAFITERDPPAARKWLLGVLATAEAVPPFPLRGSLVEGVEGDSVRQVYYRDYRIIYEIHPRSIAILTVRHGSQVERRDEIDS